MLCHFGYLEVVSMRLRHGGERMYSGRLAAWPWTLFQSLNVSYAGLAPGGPSAFGVRCKSKSLNSLKSPSNLDQMTSANSDNTTPPLIKTKQQRRPLTFTPHLLRHFPPPDDVNLSTLSPVASTLQWPARLPSSLPPLSSPTIQSYISPPPQIPHQRPIRQFRRHGSSLALQDTLDGRW